MEHFFSTYSSEHQRPSQIIGEDANVDHIQTIGGGYSQIIGEDISGFGTPGNIFCKTLRISTVYRFLNKV